MATRPGGLAEMREDRQHHFSDNRHQPCVRARPPFRQHHSWTRLNGQAVRLALHLNMAVIPSRQSLI